MDEIAKAGLRPIQLREQPKARYRVNLPIMVLAFRDNHHAAVNIDAGQVFEVVGAAEDDRFVVVEVKGEQFLVFDSDLKDRGKLQVTAPKAAVKQATVGA